MNGGEFRRLRLSALALLIGLVAIPAVSSQARLPTKLRTTIEQQVIPAYHQGDSTTVLRILSPLLSRLPDDLLAEMDDQLRQDRLPSLAQLLASARTTSMRQPVAGIPRPSQRELLLVLPVWHAELSVALAEENRPTAIRNPPPRGSSMEVYEKLLWELHVADNQLRNTQLLADQIIAWTERGLNRTNLTEQQRELLEFDYPAASQQIETLGKQVFVRDLNLRAQRLQDAVDDLVEKKDYRSRLLAASALATDSRLLAEYLGQHPQLPEDRDVLNETLTAAGLGQLVRQGELAAGEQLLTQSQLLFEGLHWWIRGRYGRGSEGAGLFKSKQVIKIPQLRFGLYMPTDPPQPTPPAFKGNSVSVPMVDRRHHYVWAWENQGIEFRKFSGQAKVTSREFY